MEFNLQYTQRVACIMFAPGYEHPYIPLFNTEDKASYIAIQLFPGISHINALISEMVGQILPKSPHSLALIIKSKEMQIFFMMKFRLQRYRNPCRINPPRCSWSVSQKKINDAKAIATLWKKMKSISFQVRVRYNQEQTRISQLQYPPSVSQILPYEQLYHLQQAPQFMVSDHIRYLAPPVSLDQLHRLTPLEQLQQIPALQYLQILQQIPMCQQIQYLNQLPRLPELWRLQMLSADKQLFVLVYLQELPQLHVL